MNRVVITGIGVVSPFGVGRERFWDAVSRGCSGTRAITEFDASEFACRVAAPVSHVTIDEVPALDGDDIWEPEKLAFYIVLAFFAKCILYDTILGLGTTPALKGDVSIWAGLVMSFYFGKRTFENVARIIKR